MVSSDEVPRKCQINQEKTKLKCYLPQPTESLEDEKDEAVLRKCLQNAKLVRHLFRGVLDGSLKFDRTNLKRLHRAQKFIKAVATKDSYTALIADDVVNNKYLGDCMKIILQTISKSF